MNEELEKDTDRLWAQQANLDKRLSLLEVDVKSLQNQLRNLSKTVEKIKISNKSWLDGAEECRDILNGLLEG